MKSALRSTTHLFLAGILLCLYSCEKLETEDGLKLENLSSKSSIGNTSKIIKDRLVENEIFFAKTLAKALKQDQSVRDFIKKEALKTFDKDYDVLYELVKDVVLTNNETLKDKLIKYSGNSARLTEIENESPLLTIFVPILPSGFSADTWSTTTDIPLVATQHIINNKTQLYNGTDKITEIPADAIPGGSAIVVKQNERIVVREGNSQPKDVKRQSKMFVNSKKSFEFLDESFNVEVLVKDRPEFRLQEAETPDFAITANTTFTLVNAIKNYRDIYDASGNIGVQWQRDNVYYGLTSSNTTGAYKPQISEFLYAMKFQTPLGYNKISDGSGDPSVSGAYWTEGFFEFQVDLIINSTIGFGTTVTKFFPVLGRDLFDVSYTYSNGVYYFNTTPKVYYPNIQLVPWNIHASSIGWKIIMSEVDPAQSVTSSQSNTATHVANFTLGFAKIGLGFGLSSTFTTTQSYSLTTTLSSDALGDAAMSFYDPITLAFSPNAGGSFQLKATPIGGWLDVAIIPKATY